MTLVVKIDPKTELFRGDYAANAADLPGAGLAWLDRRRRAAMEAFAARGMPTRRMEAWKYTDIAAALDRELEPATPHRAGADETGLLADPFSGIEAVTVTFANGYLHRIDGAPLPESLDIVDLAQLSVRTPGWVSDRLGLYAAGADQALGAASLALMRGGVAVRVRAGATGLPPLHLRFINPDRGRALIVHARILLVVEENAALTLLESHVGTGHEQVLNNLGAEIVLGPGAGLDHVRLQAEASEALHVTSVGGVLARDAAYRGLTVNLGAQLSRLDLNLHLSEPGASAALSSATAIGDEALADVTTVMDHGAPHTVSRQLFKSVVGERARAVAQGRVSVREGAVKSDSHQLFKAILLAPRAEADAKPELEIFADDVVCGHGTAVGALDEDALFYLRARGIPEPEAKQLLVRAFLEDAMADFVPPVLHDALWTRIDAVLTSMGDVP